VHEHYFANALQPLYSIEQEEAYKVLKTLGIYHPYGKVGDVQFGHIRTNFGSLSEQIKTYTEQATSDERDQYQSAVSQADAIVFLGFAYQRNLPSSYSPRPSDRRLRVAAAVSFFGGRRK
jgi:hypothetical protein